LFNAAAHFASQLNVTCVIFHDVDMLPQSDYLHYGCPPIGTVKHLGAYVDTREYGYFISHLLSIVIKCVCCSLYYNEIVGGVLIMNIVDYARVNGFSNLFWGWGGEDDDLGRTIRFLFSTVTHCKGMRILKENMKIERPDKSYGRYTMQKHVPRNRANNDEIYRLFRTSKTRYCQDGLVQWIKDNAPTIVS
jgi:hypothetical protein